jgi:hypothetical protein
MGKFEETFDDVVSFSDNTYVVSGEYSANEAAEIIGNYIGEDIEPEQLQKERVRFGFPPDFVEDGKDLGACWYTGAGDGKGTKPVWVCGS